MSGRTLIFGGSFDPPHLGHARALAGLLDLPDVTKILVIPAAQSPLKGSARATADQRLTLTRLLMEEEVPPALAQGRLELLDLEIRRAERSSAPSYTWDTVQELKHRGYSRLTVVMGTDQLQDFRAWHRWEALAEDVTFLVLLRKGQGGETPNAALRALPERLRERFEIRPTSAPEVSSTFIREMIAKTGQVPANSLSPGVERQLKAWGLYGIEVRS